MKTLFLRGSVVVVGGLFAILSSGCIVPGGGYGYDGDADVGVGYYEPVGGYYGGWGPGYRVGPGRGGDYRGGRGGGGPGPAHAYRSAPASHPMPSIPSRSRGGGGSRR